MSTRPTGYERTYLLPAPDPRCEIGVGFDVERGVVQRFLVQLQLAPDTITPASQQIGRIDHNPGSDFGHDLRTEGVHVDVVFDDDSERTLRPRGGAYVQQDTGDVIDQAIEYFRDHCEYFRRVHREAIDPDDPPRWP